MNNNVRVFKNKLIIVSDIVFDMSWTVLLLIAKISIECNVNLQILCLIVTFHI